MRTHVTITAALFIALGAALIIASAFSLVAFGALAGYLGASSQDATPLAALVLGLTGLGVTLVFLVFSIPSLVCGWGLLKYRRWARVLGIVLAAVALLRFPLGTVFGVYVLWVLFSKRTEMLFDGEPAAMP